MRKTHKKTISREAETAACFYRAACPVVGPELHRAADFDRKPQRTRHSAKESGQLSMTHGLVRRINWITSIDMNRPLLKAHEFGGHEALAVRNGLAGTISRRKSQGCAMR